MDDQWSSLNSRVSERAIRNALRLAALQHPVSVLSLALAAVSLIHLIGFSPFPLPKIWAVISLVVGGVTAFGSFFWTYSVRNDDEYDRLLLNAVEKQAEKTQAEDEAELIKLSDMLEAGFSQLSSIYGLTALRGLVHEHQSLQLVLGQPGATSYISLACLPGLSEETFRQGLNVLASCLHMSRTLDTSNKDRLEEEIVEIQEKIETLRNANDQARRVEIMERAVANRQERLELLNQQQMRVDELYYQCDRCEASLARTRIEIAALQAGTSETSVSSVIETLQTTIDQAKEVQEEMKKQGL